MSNNILKINLVRTKLSAASTAESLIRLSEIYKIQLNLSTMCHSGAKLTGHGREVAAAEMFQKEKSI